MRYGILVILASLLLGAGCVRPTLSPEEWNRRVRAQCVGMGGTGEFRMVFAFLTDWTVPSDVECRFSDGSYEEL